MKTRPLGDVLADLTRRAIAAEQAPSPRELELIDQIVAKHEAAPAREHGARAGA